MSINSNWELFKNLLISTNRDGVNDLVSFLENETDFKTAPASTKYHSNKEGGLCEHSLNVYKNLKLLNDTFNTGLDVNSMILVSLLHDLSKINFYEKTIRNKKVYSPSGSKSDDLGRFDWVSVYDYVIKDPSLRFIGSTHEVNSFLIASRFITLDFNEVVAIINHHAGMGDPNPNRDLNEIFHQNKLAALLHSADYLATYINE